jgi:hypothetical protein
VSLIGDSNRSGQAYALTVITPIVPGEEQALRDYLEGLPRDTGSPLAKLRGTHFGRWVILSELLDDGDAKPAPDDLGCQYLIFTSNFDGPLHAYLDELCERLAPEAREIWGRCVGCPASASGPELKRYLLHNQIDTGFFVAAYPHATVAKVKQALETRDRVIDLAVNGQGMGPTELRRAFDEALGA